MITRIWLACTAFLLVNLVTQAKHYSFVGGYPASGVTAERAKSVERGGACVKAKASTTYRDGQGRLQGTKE